MTTTLPTTHVPPTCKTRLQVEPFNLDRAMKEGAIADDGDLWDYASDKAKATDARQIPFRHRNTGCVHWFLRDGTKYGVITRLYCKKESV